MAHTKGKLNIPAYRHMGIQGIVLEYHTDVPVLCLHLVHSLTIKKNIAFCRRFQPRNHGKCGAFPTARRPQKAHQLPLPDFDGQSFNSRGVPEFLGYIL